MVSRVVATQRGVLPARGFIWLLALLVLGGCGEAKTPLHRGQPAPSFTLQKLEGGTVHFLADFKGKVVAIQFWAGWCSPCLTEMKALAPVYKQYKSQGLVVLAVNLRQDKETVSALAAQLKVPYQFLLDEVGMVADRYGVVGLPMSYIVDQDGLIRSRILGESTAETFEQIVRDTLHSDS